MSLFSRFLFVCLLFGFSGICMGASLEEAFDKYSKAENSSDHATREALFNEALKTFLTEAATHPSGAIFYDIGNIYAYLGDYGLALAFYRKAECLIPRDRALQLRINKVVDLANVDGYQITYPVADAIGFRWLSPGERSLLLLGLATFSFVLFSLNLWFPFVGFKWVSRLSIGCTLLLLLLLGAYYFFIPPRAVVIQAQGLKLTPMSSTESGFVLHPGEMVELLDTPDKKGLIHVRTATSLMGYLPGEAICVV